MLTMLPPHRARQVASSGTDMMPRDSKECVKGFHSKSRTEASLRGC